MKSTLPAMVLASAALLAGCGGSSQLYAADTSQEKLWTIDKSTASAQAIGTIGHDIQALACSEAVGKLYGASNTLGPPNLATLYAIDAATGAATVIGQIPQAAVNGLAYDAGHDKLYGLTLNELLLINPGNAQATSLGSPGHPDFHSLAFNPANQMLYTVRAANFYLYRIDPQTGAATPVGPTGPTHVHGLGYDGRTFTLFGVRRSYRELIKINVDTGEGTTVGSLPSGVSFNALDACAT